MPTPATVAEQLCLRCGLCCNGALFKDVELQRRDDARRLAALGLPIANPQSAIRNRQSKFPQPCAALCADNRCRIYEARPARCREFECVLFQSVAAGETTVSAALRTIGAAHRRVDEVRRLLRALDDREESLALRPRFQRMLRRMERTPPARAEAEACAELTLAVHELNHLLARSFYP